jgi:hypothetical protein
MPTLVIHSLACSETTDGAGADDVFINFRGERVWGVVEMDAGQTVHPGVQAHFFVRGRVDVWEYDSGSDNDLIGSFWVHSNQTGRGEMAVSLSGDDSDYTLVYEIVP